MSLITLPSFFRGVCAIAIGWALSSSVLWADEKAERALTAAPLFAFGGIGAAGIISPGEVAFRKVLVSNTAVPDFLHILTTGTAQAQCYALLGLHLKDRVTFDEQVKRFAASKQEVQTCAGCMMSRQPMLSVVASIQKGSFDEQAKSGPARR